MRRISAAPGRKARIDPVSARSARSDRVRDLHVDGLGGIAAEIAGFHRKRPAFARDHRGIAQRLGDPGAVDGRRHHQQAQVLAQSLLGVAGQSEAEIGVEGALVELVEQHGGDAVEAGVVENEAGEHALGDDLDAGAPRHLGAEADAVADGVADRFAQRLRHALGGGAGRQPPRLQHQDLPVRRPGLAGEHQGNPRRLAGAGRRDQHRDGSLRQRGRECGQRGVDRQRRREGVHHLR